MFKPSAKSQLAGPDLVPSNLSRNGAIPRKKPKMNPFDRLGAKQWKGQPK